MNTSRTTQRLSEPVGAEPIPPATLEYMRTRNRLRLFDLIHKELRRSGVTRAQLAKRMGRGLDRISHLLGAPGNWTLDTASDLLFAISGAEISYGVSHPLRKAPRNLTRPDWLDERQPELPKPSAMEGGDQIIGEPPRRLGLASP
jgi:hypothetical protein